MFLRSLLIKYLSAKTDRRTLSDIVDAAAIPAYRNLLPRLNKEIARSRRFKHPLTVIAIGTNSKSSSHVNKALNGMPVLNGEIYSNNPKRLTQLGFFLCGTVFRDAVREIDITAYDGANNQFVIALPETPKPQAIKMANRLTNMVGQQMAHHLSVGIAEFPTDGLIISDLLDVAMRSIINQISDDLVN